MIYLYVAYEQKDIAKSMGARWDPEKKLWYAPDNTFSKLLEAFSPIESKPKEKPKVTITKELNYIKLVGENTSFRKDELYIDLIPKNTKFSLYHSLSKDDYYRLKDTLVKRAGYRCDICNQECTKSSESNNFLCERFSYNIKLKLQKLEKIDVLCTKCFTTTRLKDKTIALEYLQELLDISKEEAKQMIYDGFENWKIYSNIEWNLDVSLITNSGLKLLSSSDSEKVSSISEESTEETKKITIKKTNTSSSSFTKSNSSSLANPNGSTLENFSSSTKKITIHKSNDECLL